MTDVIKFLEMQMPTYRTRELGYKLHYGMYCSMYCCKRKGLKNNKSANMKVSEQCGIRDSKGNQIIGFMRRKITIKKKASDTYV